MLAGLIGAQKKTKIINNKVKVFNTDNVNIKIKHGL